MTYYYSVIQRGFPQQIEEYFRLSERSRGAKERLTSTKTRAEFEYEKFNWSFITYIMFINMPKKKLTKK